jgi:hypothetical protein
MSMFSIKCSFKVLIYYLRKENKSQIFFFIQKMLRLVLIKGLEGPEWSDRVKLVLKRLNKGRLIFI